MSNDANTLETLGVTPRFVLQHNAISRSIQNLSATAKKLTAMAMSLLPPDLSSYTASFTFAEFCKALGLGDGGEQYRAFDNAVTECLKCVISVESGKTAKGKPSKTSAQALKSQWNTYASNWSSGGASAISAINTLIAAIPSGTDPDPDPNPDPGAPTVTSVTVTAAGNAPSVAKGGTLQFSASVTGTGNPAQTVTWSIKETGKNTGTTINESGLLTVASAETLPTLTVEAASNVDPSKKGEKEVSVTAAVTPLTWTAAGGIPLLGSNSTGYNNTFNGIAYGGGKFVAGGQGGKAVYSTDGATWTASGDTTFGSSNAIDGIAYGNGKFVAVGARGKAVYSEDGVTWTAVTNTAIRGSIRSIAYGGGTFVAVGYGGKAIYSNPQE